MVLTAFTTGSGEKPTILFIDGETAYRTYGAEKRVAIQCPQCNGAISQLLSFNPTDSYYYIAPCPICGKFTRYADTNGNLVDVFTVVRSGKRTPLDIDTDVPNNWV